VAQKKTYPPLLYKKLQTARSLLDGFPRFYEVLHILRKAVRAVLLEGADVQDSLLKAADNIDTLFAGHVPLTRSYHLE